MNAEKNELTLFQVPTRMVSNNSQTDEKLFVTPQSRVTFCQRGKSKNGSFVSTLRDHFHEFIHASTDEHRTCLRNTIQKLFGKNSDSPGENETTLPLQSATEN
ncbi:hypothetical protein QN277_027758 [Acacia crassicarpa]|uniref:Uncharacterized protein n=2 Tax=Acacia crassicarpa TaxID=499986 RepID=A0AAE1J4G2_9FABA|nr:hypothetical protein QN277_027758 [Acacia crassicarpa]